MKTLKLIALQLKRIADSLMMIEMTLMKINKVEYTELKHWAKDYEETAKELSSQMLDEKEDNV